MQEKCTRHVPAVHTACYKTCGCIIIEYLQLCGEQVYKISPLSLNCIGCVGIILVLFVPLTCALMFMIAHSILLTITPMVTD